MTHNLWVKFPKGKRAFGSTRPLYNGDEWYDPFKNTSHNSSSRLMNMSYQIEFMVPSGVYLEPYFDLNQLVEITAECAYSDDTGRLCMVVCRHLGSSSRILFSNDPLTDCEIHVKIQYPQLNSQNNVDHILGSIKSTRKKSHPLYFGPFSFSTKAYHPECG